MGCILIKPKVQACCKNHTTSNKIYPVDDVFSRVNSGCNISEEELKDINTNIVKTPININYEIKRLESIREHVLTV